MDKAEQHLSVREALESFLAEIRKTRSESVELPRADNRILFSDLTSQENLPKLSRSTRDGYAIKLEPSETDLEKITFRVIGEARIGTVSNLTVNSSEAVKIATGASIPRGANAVSMREYSVVDGDKLRITKPLKIGENVVNPGEDLKRGQLLFRSGTRLLPHNIALLSLLGVRQVKVYSKPKIAILSTGDELEDLASKRKRMRSSTSGRAAIIDSNRPFLSSIIPELGGIPVDLGIARDNFDQIRTKMVQGLRYDGLLLSAGSSVGERDFVSRAAESIRGLRMLVHGVAMRPSSPTGLGVCRGKPVIFLPGFPTSAIVSFYIFGRPAILKMSGSSSTEMPTIRAVLDEDFEGKPGITHFVRVRIFRDGESYKATVVRPTEAQYSSWLREANGLAIIGSDGRTALKHGDEISVYPIGNID